MAVAFPPDFAEALCGLAPSFALAGEPNRRSAISAAIETGLANFCGAEACGVSDAAFARPLPREIPCAASTLATTRAISPRFTPLAITAAGGVAPAVASVPLAGLADGDDS